MDREQLLLRFFQVVAFGLRHKHYAHVVAKHKKYMQLVAGVGLDELLKQYVRREDEKLFQQRVRLTHHVVTAVSDNLLKPFYKVPRSNSARRVLTYLGDDVDDQVKELEGILDQYWGDESWDDFMATRFVELNSIDPNAFVIHEFKPFNNDTELVKPYPFEISSTEAIDYRKVNKVLEYVISMNDHMYQMASEVNPILANEGLKKPTDGMGKGRKYTMYGKNQTWQLLQVHEHTVRNLNASIEGEIIQGGEGKMYVKLGKLFYEFKEFAPHNCDEVPGFQVGYLRDLATNGETFVNPMHAAQPYIEKTIKTNSELDLVATLLAFPQMVKYGSKCEDEKCYQGYYDNGKVCNTCNGSGVRATAPSAQDAVIIPMPESREQHIPLDELIKYLSPPVDIVAWQEEYIEKLTEKARRIMYNSDTFSKRQIAQTATGENIDAQNVYDTLYPFSVKYGKTWTSGTKLMAKLASRIDNLVASLTFSKDFKLKTLQDLIIDLSIANGIGNPSLTTHLNGDIANIIFSEQPLQLQRYRLKEMLNPFEGKSEREINMLMSSQFVSKQDKVLHANYGRIFDELELQYAVGEGNDTNVKDFYKLNRIKQREAVYKKVDEIIAILEEEQPDPEVSLGE